MREGLTVRGGKGNRVKAIVRLVDADRIFGQPVGVTGRKKKKNEGKETNINVHRLGSGPGGGKN